MKSIAIVNFNIGRQLGKQGNKIQEAHEHLLTAKRVVRTEGLHPSYLSTTIDQELLECEKKNRILLPDKKTLDRQTQFTHRLLKLGCTKQGADIRKSPYMGKGLLSAYLKDEDEPKYVSHPNQYSSSANRLTADELEFDEPEDEDLNPTIPTLAKPRSMPKYPNTWKSIKLPKECEEEEEAIASIFKHKYMVGVDGVRRPGSGMTVEEEALDAWDVLQVEQTHEGRDDFG